MQHRRLPPLLGTVLSLSLSLLVLLVLLPSPATSERLLYAGDCTGAHHFFPGDPFEVNVNDRYAATMLEVFTEAVVERAKCACPSIDDDTIKTLFLPSLRSMLNHYGRSWDAKTTVPDECLQKFATKFFDHSARATAGQIYNSGAFHNLFMSFAGTTATNDEWPSNAQNLMPAAVWMALSMPLTAMALPDKIHEDGPVLLPLPSSTCTVETVAAGDGCAFSVTEPSSSTTFHVAMNECPASNLTYTHVSCNGGWCETIANLCRTDADCGPLECRLLVENDDLQSAMQGIDLLPDDDDVAACGSPQAVGNVLVPAVERAVLGRTLSGPINGLSMCVPTDDQAEAFGDSFSAVEHTETDMADIPAAKSRVDACTAAGCPSIRFIGDGFCQTACNVTECQWDGADCQTLPALDCPTSDAYPSEECSGSGTCVTAGVCSCDCGSTMGGADCSGCAYGRNEGSNSDLEDDDDYHLEISQLEAMTSGPMTLQPWDGTLTSTPTSVFSDDRMSGSVYNTPPTVLSPKEAPNGETMMMYTAEDGSMGFSALNPNLGMAVSSPTFPKILSEVLGTILPSMVRCKATSLSQPMLSDHDMRTAHGVLLPQPWLYQFTQVPSSFRFDTTWTCGWLVYCPTRDDGTDWLNHFRLQMPESCALQGNNDIFSCAFQYTNLASLLGLPSATLNFEWSGSSRYPTPAIPNVGITVDRNFASLLAAPTPCTSNTDCPSGTVCLDLAGPNGFNLPADDDGSWDPFGFPLFGKRQNAYPTCANPKWAKHTFRQMFLRLGNIPRDDGSDLRFCFISPDYVEDNAEAWSEDLADTSCTDDDTCYTNPGTVKGLEGTTINVAPRAAPSANIVADTVPPVEAGFSQVSVEVALSGVSLTEGDKEKLKAAIAEVAAPVGGVTISRIYISSASVGGGGTSVTVTYEVPAASSSALSTLTESDAFFAELGSELSSVGAAPADSKPPKQGTLSDDSGLSGGAIAGIVIAVLVVFGAGIGAVMLFKGNSAKSISGKTKSLHTTTGVTSSEHVMQNPVFQKGVDHKV